MPAAIVTTTWRLSSVASSRATLRTCWGLTAITIRSAWMIAAASMAAKVATPNRAATVARVSGLISTTDSAFDAWPRAISPPISARAMFPPPMNVIFNGSPLQSMRPLAAAGRRFPARSCKRLGSCAWPEQSAADADHRRALGDRCLEITRHAHRQGVEHKPFGLRGGEDFAQQAELRALPRCLGLRCGDSHEAAQCQARQRAD